MVKKFLIIVFSIMLFVAIIIFTFVGSKISREEILEGVYDYHFKIDWSIYEGDYESQYIYIQGNPSIYHPAFSIHYGMSDFILVIDGVFNSYQSFEDIPSDLFENQTGKIYGTQEYLNATVEDNVDELNYVPVRDISLAWGNNNDSGMYRVESPVYFEIALDGFTTFGTLFIAINQFGITFESAFDFNDVDGFWDGLLATLNVLALPVYAIVGFLKSFFLIIAIFGGLVTV